MPDTDKVKAGLRTPIAFAVPTWMAGALLAFTLGVLGGGAAWLQNSATKQELMVQKLDQQVTATGDLKAEVKELRNQLGDDNHKLRAEVNALRERVAALEARNK